MQMQLTEYISNLNKTKDKENNSIKLLKSIIQVFM